MLPLSHTIALWSAAAAADLVAALWQSVILAAGVAWLLGRLPGATAALRSLVWSVVLLLLIALHFGLLGRAGLPARAAGMPGAFRGVHALQLDPRWSLAIVGVWALAVLVRGAHFAGSAASLAAVARRASPAGAPLSATLLRCRRFGRPVELCTSADVDRPSVIGFFQPRILLPPTLLAELTPAELEHVLLHECEHLRRGDDWTNLLQKLALVVFPLNPALGWVERRICLERELACDDGVLRATHAPKAYATCLARLAEHAMMLRDASSLALGALGAAIERRSELARRVHRILSTAGAAPEEGLASESGRRPAALLAGLLIAVLTGGAALLDQSPRLVSFAAQPAPAQSAMEQAQAQGRAQAQAASPHMQLASLVQTVRGPARPLLISAVLRPYRSVSPIRPLGAKRRRRPVGRPSVFRAKRARPLPSAPVRSVADGQRTPMVVLTSWQTPAVLMAAPQATSYSFAAVRVPDGWLIVSL